MSEINGSIILLEGSQISPVNFTSLRTKKKINWFLIMGNYFCSETITCGEGTKLVGQECVKDGPTTECGEGTKLVGKKCVSKYTPEYISYMEFGMMRSYPKMSQSDCRSMGGTFIPGSTKCDPNVFKNTPLSYSKNTPLSYSNANSAVYVDCSSSESSCRFQPPLSEDEVKAQFCTHHKDLDMCK